LRAALADGGTVTFASDAVIALSHTVSITTNAVLDGTGHQITVSGNNAVGVFSVASGVSFMLTNLTIANGASSSGAGIVNNGGIVVSVNCRFVANNVPGFGDTDTGQSYFGGAVYNSGSFTALNCAFVSNSIVGGNGVDP
jgi:hypothetical protein